MVLRAHSLSVNSEGMFLTPCLLNVSSLDRDIVTGMVMIRLTNGDTFILPFSSINDYNSILSQLFTDGYAYTYHAGFFRYDDDSLHDLRYSQMVTYDDLTENVKAKCRKQNFPMGFSELILSGIFNEDDYDNLLQKSYGATSESVIARKVAKNTKESDHSKVRYLNLFEERK